MPTKGKERKQPLISFVKFPLIKDYIIDERKTKPTLRNYVILFDLEFEGITLRQCCTFTAKNF